MNATAKLEISRGPLRVALLVSVHPAALARQALLTAPPEGFEAWVDATLPPLLVACEPTLAQAARQLQAGLELKVARYEEAQLLELKAQPAGSIA